MAHKILYLDYDGVLHDEAVFVHPKWGIYLDTPGRTLFEWMPILEQLLEPHPDVKIVLSTSWVRMRNFNYAREQLSPALQMRVVGATYHHRLMAGSDFSEMSRGAQIEADVFRRTPAAWFAIDDDDHNWPDRCRDKLIHTDGSTGISDLGAQRAISEMLKSLSPSNPSRPPRLAPACNPLLSTTQPDARAGLQTLADSAADRPRTPAPPQLLPK